MPCSMSWLAPCELGGIFLGSSNGLRTAIRLDVLMPWVWTRLCGFVQATLICQFCEGGELLSAIRKGRATGAVLEERDVNKSQPCQKSLVSCAATDSAK